MEKTALEDTNVGRTCQDGYSANGIDGMWTGGSGLKQQT